MNAASNHRIDMNSVEENHHDNIVPLFGARQVGGTEAQQSALPAPGEHAVVRCRGFQCLAYRDSDGTWRDVRSRKRLPEVLEIVMRL
jgi:hypothetical protein